MNILIINSLFDIYNNVDEMLKKYLVNLSDFKLVFLSKSSEVITQNQIRTYFYKYKRGNHKWSMKNIDLRDKNVCIFIKSVSDTQKYFCDFCDVIFFVDKDIQYQELQCKSKYLRLISQFFEYSKTLEVLAQFQKERNLVENFIQNGDYFNASKCLKKMASCCIQLNLNYISKDYYAFSAIMAERTESWRNISFLWYSAYENIEKNTIEYNDYNTLSHSYPTISFEKWLSFSSAEKKGRALQYSAYSADNYLGPSDSYWIFEKAAKEYFNAKCYERAVECLVSATNRYSIMFHQINPEIMEFWKKLLNVRAVKEQEDLLLCSFKDIYSKLNLYKSESAKFFYIQVKKIEQSKLKKNKKYVKYIFSKIGTYLTMFGFGTRRIVIITLIAVLILYPFLYFLTCCSQNIFYGVLDSINIFLGIKYFECNNILAYFIMITEIIYSYFFLVVLSTQFLGKVITDHI